MKIKKVQKPDLNMQIDEYYKNPSNEILEKILEDNKSFIYSMIIKSGMKTTSNDFEDAVSMGYMGFLKALKTFDPSKGFKFTSYCGKIIHNDLCLYYRKNSKSVEFGSYSLNYLIQKSNDHKEISIIDTIIDTRTENEFKRFENMEFIQFIISDFNPKQKRVIELYYFEGMSQADISKLLKIGQPYVSKIINMSDVRLKKIKNKKLSNYFNI